MQVASGVPGPKFLRANLLTPTALLSGGDSRTEERLVLRINHLIFRPVGLQ